MTRPAIIRADARALPLPDDAVDLIVTSPPYYALRSYRDGGEHYDGQIGAESTPDAYVASLLDVTRECMRVLKPSGSLWVNLGDKYAGAPSGPRPTFGRAHTVEWEQRRARPDYGTPTKSLLGLPWRYALRCVDELGLTLRAEVIWSKPNGLPESVTDRVRRSHEQWFHFVQSPRYYSAVDEIRETYTPGTAERYRVGYRSTGRVAEGAYTCAPLASIGRGGDSGPTSTNPLGKLPGSVWEIATQPLTVPDSLGVDHFAAFPMEWPRRLVLGWSPRHVCTTCGEGRRPVTSARVVGITGYVCACDDTSAPTTSGVVLDPFGGTGTTALVASMLGRDAVSVDASADYCRLAEWRINDPVERARAAGTDTSKVDRPSTDQPMLFEMDGAS